MIASINCHPELNEIQVPVVVISFIRAKISGKELDSDFHMIPFQYLSTLVTFLIQANISAVSFIVTAVPLIEEHGCSFNARFRTSTES